MLSFSANQPDRAAGLVNRGDAGLSMPIFFNDYLYCGPELIRRFCEENGREIEALRLQDGERFSVQRRQLRLRLVTDSPERIVSALDPVGRIFHRYVRV